MKMKKVTIALMILSAMTAMVVIESGFAAEKTVLLSVPGCV
jgi:hypothetical protein